MKILHTADWHLGTFRSPVKDGVNLRTEDTKRCLNEMIRVAGEERPDYSLVSGDHSEIPQEQTGKQSGTDTDRNAALRTAFHGVKAADAAMGGKRP